MAKYQIPKDFITGFDVLAKLSVEDVQRIVTAIEKIPVGEGPTTFAEILSQQVQIDNIKPLSKTVYSFGSLLNAHKGDESELIRDIVESYSEVCSEELTSKQTEYLAKNIAVVFRGGDNLKLTFKAINLLLENERVYKNCRILTDIRLVFNDDLKNVNRYAVMQHQLKIDFEENGDNYSFFFSLDNKDLKKLRDQLDRALDKGKIIVEDYSNIKFIEITD